jgi:hypothetical protein
MRYFYGPPDDDSADDPADDAAGNPADPAEDAGRERDDHDDDDPALEDDFPLGDGTADTSAVIYCPYCGELNEIAVDPGGGASQSYVEDCQVCCQPWHLTIAYDAAGHAFAAAEAADE